MTRESDTVLINTIETSVDQDNARDIVSRYSEGYSVQVQKKIFYPYYWVYFSYRVKTLLGKGREHNASCLVDLINNQASTSDRFTVTETDAIIENVLECDYTPETALKTAQTYFTHSFIHNTRLLSVPEAEILEEKLVYKPFWVVKCGNQEKNSFRVIVDAATGKFQLL